MTQFIDFQEILEEDEYTSSEDCYNEDDEANSLIDDSFEADEDPHPYYIFKHVTKNAD